jgi:hypothetical protein
MFDTLGYTEQKCIEGGFRKIDSIAVYENLVATAESQSIRFVDPLLIVPKVGWI